MGKSVFTTIFFVCLSWNFLSAADITIDVSSQQRQISPLLYGINNALSSDTSAPTSDSAWTLYQDAGIRFFRENSGNNASKYNWRKKMTSHPDWYNNVHHTDWNYEAQSLIQKMPSTYGMWAIPLTGWAASSDSANFDCWNYDKCIGTDAHKNFAGEGDFKKYLEPWPVDSALGILNHWFSASELNLPFENFKYWNLDNEPDIWASTHDDVFSSEPDFEDFFKKFIDATSKMRQLYPQIKVVGPVLTNEWMWYTWYNNALTDSKTGKAYNLTEWFIKRLGEAEDSLNLQLLDVFDIHWYPGETTDEDFLQLHRVLFDTTYRYPGANGVHMVSGSWDQTAQKEYILARIQQWSQQYLGREIELALSETGFQNPSPMIAAILHANMLGTMAQHGVKIYTPWTWHTGYWETVHLYSRYFGQVNVAANRSNESFSSYAALSNLGDTLSMIVINQEASSQDVSIDLQSFNNPSLLDAYRLQNLTQETFVSHSQNALETFTPSLQNNTITATLPPLSINLIRLTGSAIVTQNKVRAKAVSDFSCKIHANHIMVYSSQAGNVSLYNLHGQKVLSTRIQEHQAQLQTDHLNPGTYILKHAGHVQIMALQTGFNQSF